MFSMRDLDRNGDQIVEEYELDSIFGQLARFGVEATVDGFEGRWDLDGDGKVEEDELPLGPYSVRLTSTKRRK